tara:strand:- start:2219 stop:2383 length:165 start_codon:yes stop_codon:yes gene_type:complete
MTQTVTSLDGKTVLNIEIGKETLSISQQQDDKSFICVMMASGDFKQSTNFKIRQ